MVWLLDDLAEAALGPWGVAVAVGVGLATAARGRWGDPAIAARPATAGIVIPGTAVAARTESAAPDGSTMPSAAERFKERVQGAVAGAGEYWRELYAEARQEWEQARAGAAAPVRTGGPAATGAAPTGGAGDATPPVIPAAASQPAAKSAGRRVRGPNGRYVRGTA